MGPVNYRVNLARENQFLFLKEIFLLDKVLLLFGQLFVILQNLRLLRFLVEEIDDFQEELFIIFVLEQNFSEDIDLVGEKVYFKVILGGVDLLLKVFPVLILVIDIQLLDELLGDLKSRSEFKGRSLLEEDQEIVEVRDILRLARLFYKFSQLRKNLRGDLLNELILDV